MTRTVQEMKDYTNQEWRNLEYFTNLIEALKEAKIKSIADVGACFGEVSKILMERIPTIEYLVAVEPILVNFSVLKENFRDSKVKCRLENCAVFYGKDVVTLGTSHGNMGGYGIHSDGIINNHENVTSGIRTETLENLLKDGVDFLKMDVEGAEKNIIENSSVLSKVKFMEIEFHDELSEPEKHLPFLEKHLPNHVVVSYLYRYGGGNNVFMRKR